MNAINQMNAAQGAGYEVDLIYLQLDLWNCCIYFQCVDRNRLLAYYDEVKMKEGESCYGSFPCGRAQHWRSL